jgi:hypothetical protein
MDDKNQTANYLETKVSDSPITDMKDLDRRGSVITDRNVITDNVHEHQLTFIEVARYHKALIWWSFYFAMCAVGWGFDAQVNGAMISVPSFRRDFGYAPSLGISWKHAQLILVPDTSTKGKPSFLLAGSPHSISSGQSDNFLEASSAATSLTRSAVRKPSRSVSSSAPVALSDRSSQLVKGASSALKLSLVLAWASTLLWALSAARRSPQSSSVASLPQESTSALPWAS